MLRKYIIGIYILFMLTPSFLMAQNPGPGYEFISVYVRVQRIGGTEMECIYSYSDNRVYLPINDLFRFLKINEQSSLSNDSISGFIIDEDKKYLIDYSNKSIEIGGNIINLAENDILKSESGLYLFTGVFGRTFGLFCTFNFRGLTVELKTDLELPAIREMRLQQMRKNIDALKGEVKVDTTFNRKYHLLKFGMFDWSINSTQISNYTSDTRLSAGIGAEFLGGETNIILNYSTRDGYNERNQQYYWRWANNKPKLLRQIKVGKISPGSISSIYDPVLGVQITNTPTSYRRSFGEYNLTGYTEPGWTAELYINNVIVDYQTADASGFYSFVVPMVYGQSQVELKFYGPYGEERIRTQTLSVPYNFLPKGEAEYFLSSGMVQDSSHSNFTRGEVNYGINRFLTVGGGVEHLTSISTRSEIPFLKASLTPVSNLMISGEYDHGVRSIAMVSYRLPSNAFFEIDYTNYVKDQKAIRFNYLEKRKISLSIPLNLALLKGYTRLGFKQNVYETLTYNSGELLLSTYIGRVNANITTFANWVDIKSASISSTIALSIKLWKNITLRSQAMVDYKNNELISYKFELEKRILRTGYFSLSYEDILRSAYKSVDLTFRYDLPFAQTNLSTRFSDDVITTTQGARGSIAFGSGNGYVYTDNRSMIGRGAITLIPFLDINHNGQRDESEPITAGLDVRINGGRILNRANDSLTRIVELEPYTNYLLELDDVGFEEISWRLHDKAINVFIDPNQFKKIEIPVVPVGEINGMVYLKSNRSTRGLGRVIINIKDLNGQMVTKLVSESDGYFTFLGLAPGKYVAQIDSVQMQRINMTADPNDVSFEIHPSAYGDIVDNINFVLTKNEIEEPPKPIEEEETKPEDLELFVDDTLTDTIQGEGETIIYTEIPTGEDLQQNLRERDSISPWYFGDVNPEAGKYFVQGGSFSSETNARLLNKLLKSAVPYPVGIIKEEEMFKVRFGYFKIKTEAQHCYHLLKDAGFDAYIGLKKR